jgi:surfactin synthase thioesterase subunit
MDATTLQNEMKILAGMADDIAGNLEAIAARLPKLESDLSAMYATTPSTALRLAIETVARVRKQVEELVRLRSMLGELS